MMQGQQPMMMQQQPMVRLYDYFTLCNLLSRFSFPIKHSVDDARSATHDGSTAANGKSTPSFFQKYGVI